MAVRDVTSERKARHFYRIKGLIVEMRRTLRKSEQARDRYYDTVDAYKTQRGLTGFELDKAVEADRIAQGAISDSQLYDRWATKYAAVVQAEIAAYNIGLHVEEQ